MPITIEEAYQVLGIEIGSSEEIVKKQYKKLALKTHPDKNPDDPEAGKKFLMISEAYKRITDPDSFKEEDEMGNEEEMEAMFNEMFAEMFGFSGLHSAHVPFELFSMFESMMGADSYGDDDEGIYFSMPAHGMFGFHPDDDEDDEYYYDDDEYDEDDAAYFMANGGLGGPGGAGLFEAMLLNEIFSGQMGGQGFPSGQRSTARPKVATGKTQAPKGNKSKNAKKAKATKREETMKNSETFNKSNGQPRNPSNNGSKSSKPVDDEQWETADEDSDDPNAESSARNYRKREDIGDEEIRRFQGRGDPLPQKLGNTKHEGGRASRKASRQYEAEADEADLMEMMMGQMAMELGIPGGGDMLQFLMQQELGMDGAYDDSDEDDEEMYREHSKSKKNKKKKNNKKGTKKSSPTASSSQNIPSSSTRGTTRFPDNRNVGDDSTLVDNDDEDDVPPPLSAVSSSDTANLYGIKVGDRVLISKKQEGKVAFVGDVHYAKGTYVGVIMKDANHGKNTGTIRGVEYFRCKPHERGLMVPLIDVTLVK